MSDRAGISDGFVYAPKPAAAPAANIRVSVPPFNKDVFKHGNESIMFNIPCGKRGQYLNTRMSYLKFELDVTMKPGTDNVPIIRLDKGAHSLISSLELYHGTNLLEQIREYNALYTLHMDMSEHRTVQTGGPRSVSEGTQEPYITPMTAIPGLPHFVTGELNGSTPLAVGGSSKFYSQKDWDVTVSDKTLLDTAKANLSGLYKATVLQGKTVTYTFAIPIMSGIIGTGMGKYIPVGALAADLRMELGLASWGQAFKTIGVLNNDKIQVTPSMIYASKGDDLTKHYTFELKNAELQLEYIEVASDVQMAIESSTGGQYVMSFDSFFNYQNAIPAGASSFAQLIGAKFSSIKTVLSMFRDGAAQSVHALSGLSRLNPFSVLPNRREMTYTDTKGLTKYQNGGGWYYSIGATHYPPRPIVSDEESWYEAVKSQHLLGAADMPGAVNRHTWGISAMRDGSNPSAAWNEHPLGEGTFFTAQNLESQSHKSHLAESGVNTLAQNMYFHARFPGTSSPFGATQSYPWGTFTVDTGKNLTAGADFTYSTTSNAAAVNPITWQQTMQQMQVDHFVHYDGLLIVTNGIANTRF